MLKYRFILIIGTYSRFQIEISDSCIQVINIYVHVYVLCIPTTYSYVEDLKKHLKTNHIIEIL